MKKRMMLSLLLVAALFVMLLPTAYAEQGKVEGNNYYFTDRNGDQLVAPLNGFAARVVKATPGNPWTSYAEQRKTENMLGMPDRTGDQSTSKGDYNLGAGGSVILGFDVDVFDGEGYDVYVFEVGGLVEDTKVAVSRDLETWYEVGTASGKIAGVDLAGKVPEGSTFRYVRLTDAYSDSSGSWPGADIDAVCGLSTKVAPRMFDDVPQDAYYSEPVEWAVRHDPQITNGTGNKIFSPDKTCTRGEAVTFLWRSVGCPEAKNPVNPFSDVHEGDYFYKAVLWAVERGITNGTSATTFSPHALCTRAHVVTFLWRGDGEPKMSAANPFVDVAPGAYYADAVVWALSKQITNGTTATTFSPDQSCTRGQIVTFLYRDLGK